MAKQDYSADPAAKKDETTTTIGEQVAAETTDAKVEEKAVEETAAATAEVPTETKEETQA